MPHDAFGLGHYLARIGLASTGGPSLDLLRRIVLAHATAIPFENLDVVLGRPIVLDIVSVQRKLVDARRGGYCFEQNTLLRAALEALGFRVTSLMARVLRGAPAHLVTPRTHMLLRVDLPEGAYLADVGFGNMTPTAPLRLDTDEIQATPHEPFRLLRRDGEVTLEVRPGDAFEQIYRFDERPTWPVDHEVGSWFTSTRPGGLFTSNVIVAKPGNMCRTTFFNGVLKMRRFDAATEFAEAGEPADLHRVLSDAFGIVLPSEDVTAVFDAIQRFAGGAGPQSSFD